MITGLMAYVFAAFLGNVDVMVTLLVWGFAVTILLATIQIYQDVTGE